jgi:hypothetical protein
MLIGKGGEELGSGRILLQIKHFSNPLLFRFFLEAGSRAGWLAASDSGQLLLETQSFSQLSPSLPFRRNLCHTTRIPDRLKGDEDKNPCATGAHAAVYCASKKATGYLA